MHRWKSKLATQDREFRSAEGPSCAYFDIDRRTVRSAINIKELLFADSAVLLPVVLTPTGYNVALIGTRHHDCGANTISTAILGYSVANAKLILSINCYKRIGPGETLLMVVEDAASQKQRGKGCKGERIAHVEGSAG